MSARHRFRRGPSRNSRTDARAAESVATLRIESIAAGGSGVGRSEGIACFIPRTAPDDLVQVALRMRSRFATGRLLQVLEPSAQRVAPRCSHYIQDRCGGCQLQHLDADAQRHAKSLIVRDALQRMARRDVPAPVVERGPHDWAYRRRLTLMLLPGSGGWIGGLHSYDDATRIFSLRECPISHPLLVEAWRAVDSLSVLLPAAESLRLALRLLDRGTVATVVTGGKEWANALEFGERLLASHPASSDVWWDTDAGDRHRVASRDDNVGFDVIADDQRADRLDQQPVDDSGADALAFVQINAAVAQQLREFVVQRVVERAPSSVLDVYAGSGLLTEALARRGIVVTSVEIDPTATNRAAQRVGGLANVRVLTGEAERLLSDMLRPAPDMVIVNPPRRGLEPGMPQLLNDAHAAGTRGIVYISCDPATLARDLNGMPDWKIVDLRCFDMFPQTSHVETVCLLEPGSAT